MEGVVNRNGRQALVYGQISESKLVRVCSYLTFKIKNIWHYVLGFLCCRKGVVLARGPQPSKECPTPVDRVSTLTAPVNRLVVQTITVRSARIKPVLISSTGKAVSKRSYPSGAIIDFYSGKLRPEPLHQSFDEVLAMSDDLIESGHVFIQWLFPLTSPTKYNPRVALFDSETVRVFSANLMCKSRMLAALSRMLRFYGLEITNPIDVVIRRADNFSKRSTVWMTKGNHNYLRITRIIQSLYMVGLTAHAKALSVVMVEIADNEGAGVISAQTKDLWENYR